jgi:hypothetical protein
MGTRPNALLRTLILLGVAALSVAACSGTTGIPASNSSVVPWGGQESGGETTAAPTPVKFTDFPGPDLKYQSIIAAAAVRLKPIETNWVTEIGDQTAAGGRHLLTVYVVATGELADRGVRKVVLDYPKVRYRPVSGECVSQQLTVDGKSYCYHETQFRSELKEVARSEWLMQSWHDVYVTGTDLERGESKVGVMAFGIPDASEAMDGFELCAPVKGKDFTSDEFPCIPIKTPDKPRG